MAFTHKLIHTIRHDSPTHSSIHPPTQSLIHSVPAKSLCEPFDLHVFQPPRSNGCRQPRTKQCSVRVCVCVCVCVVYVCICVCAYVCVAAGGLSRTEHGVQISHFTYQCVVSRVNTSCHISMNHVTYQWVMSHINESCHISMSHITYQWVISHINSMMCDTLSMSSLM